MSSNAFISCCRQHEGLGLRFHGTGVFRDIQEILDISDEGVICYVLIYEPIIMRLYDRQVMWKFVLLLFSKLPYKVSLAAKALEPHATITTLATMNVLLYLELISQNFN
ncbi:hypothetical protein P8452_58559 [Trifolium repens]|nr:hypothetical protein P8452_58559 [Trifolium repens]